MNKKTKKSIDRIPVILLFTVVAAALFAYIKPTAKTDNLFEITKNARIFNSVYKEVGLNYVDETKPGELMKTGIDAMLRSLDPYTNFIPESDIEDYTFMTTGEYGGIGALIKPKDGYVAISEPYEGFPAQKAGLMAGDVILKVDGKSVKGKTTSEMSEILKGQSGTKLTIEVKREGEKNTIVRELIREQVKIPDVPFYGMIDDKTGFIKLTSFTQTASTNVKEAYQKLKEEQGMEKLVLDLRGNGGGLLHESVNIVNFFTAKGQTVVSTKGRTEINNKEYKAMFNPLDTDIPLVVLVDGGSASASEIVSGALQDLDRGIVIGQNTFGKGLVQQTRDLEFNNKLKITVAKYYTPSGRCIQKLDYSHRDERGQVKEFADSTLKKFKTKNGREVIEGRGVDPDIKIDDYDYSKLSEALVINDIIFDFATQYRLKTPSIAPARQFSLSEKEYEEFMAFALTKEFSYKTDSEIMLEKLAEIARDERYYELAEKEFEKLKKSLHPEKKDDLIRFKKEIIELLENEIISRYYYQNGRIELSLGNDPFILEAKKVLNDKDSYNGILSGKINPKK
jgi:carboxyl-terminal processing protease